MEPIEDLVRALKNGNAEARAAAAVAPGRTKDGRAIHPLAMALYDTDPLVRWKAVQALRQTEEGRAVITFIEVTSEASNRY